MTGATSGAIARRRFFLATRAVVIPILVFLSVTLPHLGQGDWRGDTGWYSALGVQAWRTGDLWTLYSEPGEPYFNKPPLGLWIHGLALHIGGLSIVVGRLPTVLAAAGCVALTAWIARLLAGRAAGLACGVVLALSYEFFRRTREISLDMWQCLFMLVALLLATLGICRRRLAFVVSAGIPVGLALMCKPLMGLTALVLVAVWFAVERWWRGLWGVCLAAGVAVAVAAPWHISMVLRHGHEFTAPYFGTEIVARTEGVNLDGLIKPGPSFYAEQIVIEYWPWLAAAVLGTTALLRRRYAGGPSSATLLGLIWALAWLGLVTAFPDRRSRYAIPVYPGLALVAGVWLASGVRGRARPIIRRALTCLGPVTAVGALVIALLPVRIQSPPNPEWGMLFEWMRVNAPDGLYEGACDGAPGARVYIETGDWPHSTRDRHGNPVREPPPGAMLLYDRLGVRKPGPNEAVVFSAGQILVTRLGEGGWQPQ